MKWYWIIGIVTLALIIGYVIRYVHAKGEDSITLKRGTKLISTPTLKPTGTDLANLSRNDCIKAGGTWGGSSIGCQ